MFHFFLIENICQVKHLTYEQSVTWATRPGGWFPRQQNCPDHTVAKRPLNQVPHIICAAFINKTFFFIATIFTEIFSQNDLHISQRVGDIFRISLDASGHRGDSGLVGWLPRLHSQRGSFVRFFHHEHLPRAGAAVGAGDLLGNKTDKIPAHRNSDILEEKANGKRKSCSPGVRRTPLTRG